MCEEICLILWSRLAIRKTSSKLGVDNLVCYECGRDCSYPFVKMANSKLNYLIKLNYLHCTRAVNGAIRM